MKSINFAPEIINHKSNVDSRKNWRDVNVSIRGLFEQYYQGQS